MWDLAEDKDLAKLIESSIAAGKTIAVVCHSTGALRHVRAPNGKLLVEGKEVTGFTNGEEADVGLTKVVPFLVEDEMLKLGAVFSKTANWGVHVVKDGLLITGQNPHSSGPAAKGTACRTGPAGQVGRLSTPLPERCDEHLSIPSKLKLAQLRGRSALGDRSRAKPMNPAATTTPSFIRTIGEDTIMDLLAYTKAIAERIEAQATQAKVPVAVCVIDIHGNIILKHRMNGAPTFSLELSERKAYTSALVGLRTADLSPLVQPGQALFPLMGVAGGRFCSMGGGAPLEHRRPAGRRRRHQRRHGRAGRRESSKPGFASRRPPRRSR